MSRYGSKKKWFKPRSRPPSGLMFEGWAGPVQIAHLEAELQQHDVSKTSLREIQELLQRSPLERWVLCLQRTLKRMGENPIENFMTDALTDQERRCLVELGNRQVSGSIHDVVEQLMCLQDRLTLVELSKSSLRKLRELTNDTS